MSTVNARTERLRVALENAGDAVRSVPSEQRDASPDGADLLERVIAYAQIIVSETDGDLIPDATMNAIESSATAIVNTANAVASARAHADALLNAVSLVPAAQGRNVEQAVKDAAANFQRSASQRLRAVETEVERQTTEINEALSSLGQSVTQTTETTQARIETLASDFEAKLVEFEGTVTTQRQALDQALTRHTDSFTTAQEDRAKAFEAEVGRAKQTVDSIVTQSSEEIERHVAEIRRMERDAAGSVGAIGLAGTAERYGDEAREQKDVADFMRTLTILFAVGAVAMAAFAVVHQADDTSTVLAKLGVSAVLGALAAYTARQSGRHRTREERSRNLQLELSVFAPFIEPLDDGQKQLERVIMARRTFGQIRALPDAEGDHAYGPLGPVLDKLRRSEEEGT